MDVKKLTDKKLDGDSLSHNELEFAVMSYVDNSINDSDMATFLKSIHKEGMSRNEIVSLTTGSGSTETFMTVLNPYSILNSPRSGWTAGMPAISIDEDTGEYIEDIGPDLDYVWQDNLGWSTIGHFVLVNDTRLTNGYGWSVNPEVNVDDEGNIHVVWVDGRDSMPGKDVASQLHYMQIDLSKKGAVSYTHLTLPTKA